MRVRVIINPSSGQKNFQKNADSIVEQLLSDKTFSHAEIIKTTKEDDAYHAALNFKDSEIDLVIAVGGDGTVNEVLNGLLNGKHTSTLAILPAGTSNDFASFMNMPQDVDEFCNMIRLHKVKDIDVGKVGTQYFINVASAGILTEIPYNVTSTAKTILGQMAYYIEAAKKLIFSPKLNTLAIKIQIDDHIIEDDILLFIISNSPSAGGFHQASPKASVSDGLLDLLIIHKQNSIELVQLFVQISNGTHINNPSVSYFQTDEVIIECFNIEPVFLDIDGEKGPALPEVVRIIPHAIKLIIPELNE